MTSKRVPSEKEKFDSYFTELKIFLLQIVTGVITMGENLGMTAAEILKFTGLYTGWRSGDPLLPGIYEKYLTPEKQSKYTGAEVKKFISDFSVWFSPILVRMSGSPNITPQYRIVLHIAEPVTSHTHPTENISEGCYYKVVQLGGGVLKFSFSPSESGGRGHKPKNSDAIEFAGRMDEPFVPADTAPNELIGKVRKAIANPDDGTTKEISTKATYVKKLGAENAGKILQFYARFINTKHRDLDGPWTGPFTIIIS
jgi:hypothetical protein